jgi:hypothetical protein
MARPRLDVPVRTPSGRASRAKSALLAQGHTPAHWVRIRDEAIGRARNSQLGTELGRLFVTEAIKSSEFATGTRYAESVRLCLRTMGIRCLDPGDPPMPGMGLPLVPGTDEWQQLTDAGRDAADTLTELYGAMPTAAQRRAVDQVCLRNLSVDDFQQSRDLRAGLRSLAEHFRLIDNRRRRR